MKLRALFACVVLCGCGGSEPLAPGEVELMVSAASSSITVTRVHLTISGGAVSTPIGWDLVSSGSTWRGTVYDVPASSPGTTRFHADGYDAAGNIQFAGDAFVAVVSGQSVAVSIVLPQLNPPGFTNNNPVVSQLTASNSHVALGGSASLTATFSDADAGDALGFNWSGTGGNFLGTLNGSFTTTALAHSSTAQITWVAPTTIGQYTMTFAVTDSQGAKATGSITLSVP